MENPILKEYSRLAGVYDSRWKFYTEATAKKTLSGISLKNSDKVLDVGCGTGVLLYYLSEGYPGVQLSGIDPVKEMLAGARNRLPSSADLREGWIEHLPFSDHYFNTVFCCSMFHYIRDPVIALHEIHRILQPGGSLIITDWCMDYLPIRISDFFLRSFNKAYHQSYYQKDMVSLLKENHYTILNSDCYKINPWWGMMTVKALSNTH